MKHLIKLIHISLFMNATFSLLKNQIYLVIKKKRIWFRKIRFVFVCVEKIVFNKEKLDMCLLNKTNSFGFFLIKKSDLFLRTRKNGFLVCIKKSDLFCS